MILYDYIFGRDGGILALLLDKNTHDVHYYKWRDTAKKKLQKEKCEVFEMNGLKGFYYKAGRKPSNKIAFIVHGYRSNHAETAGVWREFYKRKGYDLFCPDNPCAGESAGNYISFDYYESKAAREWVDYLIGKFGYGVEIILHGFSLGGATVIRMSDELPDVVKFIIDDCGFTSGREMLEPKLGLLYGPVRLLNKKKAGYDLKDTDVRPHLRKEKIPILFVHGGKDRTVPFVMGQELYTNCRSEKDCLFVDRAKHMECYFYEPKQYEQKIEKFMKKYV